MSQTSIASYFNQRKRAANNGDTRSTIKNKVFVSNNASADSCVAIANDILSATNSICSASKNEINRCELKKNVTRRLLAAPSARRSSRVKKCLTRTGGSEFTVKQSISDSDRESGALQIVPINEIPVESTPPLCKSDNNEIVKRTLKTPIKEPPQNVQARPEDIKTLVRKELNFDEVKSKVSRSAKLHELKASLARIQELEKVRKEQEARNRLLKEGITTTQRGTDTVNLKEFKEIELEVLTSPKRGLKTPTKSIFQTPDKAEPLLSPKNSIKAKKLLFSPTKDGSPSKLITPPAYQRFQNLSEATTRTSLQMPYKYRCLIEMFKCLDSICAMFFNRNEVITLKKLKPAMQRMLRKNFNETHLAQIKKIYPEAYHFMQMKMRNYGSTSKQDYYQLVIAPNVGNKRNTHIMAIIDEDNVLKSAQTTIMNPQVILERQQRFFSVLLNKVKEEHDKFLKSLDPPIKISKDQITRWHPDFDLENCPEIEKALLPQPPNIEKFSSAKDILSTARNLFTAKVQEQIAERLETQSPIEESTSLPQIDLLKNVPKSLIEKIRAKQAAKMRDTMLRCPSQDREAIKFSRLPKLVGHLRNVFVTEKKNVLPLEVILKKIENSYQTTLAMGDIETHLRLIAKECSDWIEFHDIRKSTYVKIDRNADFRKVVAKLEEVANSKSK